MSAMASSKVSSAVGSVSLMKTRAAMAICWLTPATLPEAAVGLLLSGYS
jgi:hypothetical protein